MAPGEAPAPEGAASTGAIKALIVAAALPSLFALPYIAWSIADLLVQRTGAPWPAALTVGVVADIALVGSVLVALADPKSRTAATRAGWVFAVVVGVLVAVHTGWSVALVVAVLPLLCKALWGLVVAAVHRMRAARAAHDEAQRSHAAAQEAADAAARAAKDMEEARRAAELSPELTFAQRAEIVRLEREAEYEGKLAAAKLKLTEARSAAEHQAALAEIRRLGEQQRAEDAEAASVYEQRLRLERQMRTVRGEAPAFLSGPGGGVEEAEVVPEITAKAGFGAAAPSGFGFTRPLDVKALTPEGAKVRFEELPETHQQLVRYVHTAKEPTLRGAGRKLDRDQRTIGRWVDKLAEKGYELPFDRKKQ
jgi:hypothetical protein